MYPNSNCFFFLRHVSFQISFQHTSSEIQNFLFIFKNCLIVSGVRGREYKPRLSKLVLYFRNIDLCPIDCWGTSEVIELILQVRNFANFKKEMKKFV